jgi:hypothetical protein
MSPAFRKFHRRVSPWLIVPLVVTLATGIAYRIGRAWFGMDKDLGSKVLDVHSGEWLGGTGSMIYLAVVGLGLLALIVSGATLLLTSRSKIPMRLGHRIVALILMLPLTASAVTGLAYKFGEEWFHISDGTADLLMDIHQGSWLGKGVAPYYVLFVGLGLLALSWTGLQMTGLLKKKSPPGHA